MSLHVLVLAGGSGTRLWPLSRGSVPKHLLPLGPGGVSLLRATVDRVAAISGSVHVVTAASQLDGCREALQGSVAQVDLIAEPAARGTGPALGLAVHHIARGDPDALIASVHADPAVGDDDAYRAAVLAAAGWAETTAGLATVGLTPTFPSTGLGYISVGHTHLPEDFMLPSGASVDPVMAAAAAALPAHQATGFVEKPALVLAEEFVEGGHHLWNLGLFAWPAGLFLHELRTADHGLDAALRTVVERQIGGDEPGAAEAYTALANAAVEPLVFERTRRLTVVEASFGWSDLGSWADLAAARAGRADSAGNVVDGDVVLLDCHDTVVEARSGRTVAVIGAAGLVVVDTGDSLLVMPARDSQRVKELVERLRAEGRDQLL